jgi:hypothetical protein
LKVAENTAYSMAQQGQRPALVIGGLGRSNRADLDQWIEQQKAASCDHREGE